MFAKLLKPHVDLAALLLRWGLAAIFVVHGYIKVMQNASLFPQELSLTTQTVVGWAELICGLALAVGLLSRIAALGIIALQVGAIILVTGRHALEGLEIGPRGAKFTKVGPEYNLVLIIMALALLVLGSGAVSLDHLLLSRWRRKAARAVPQPVAAGKG
jgi:putative oxidoreductase